MRVVNIHERVVNGPVVKVGKLIDGLASTNDLLWPIDRWPAMQFDRPLGVGASGGHGPIRYTVESYVPGRSIQFRFTEPKEFAGTHRFEVDPIDEGTTKIRHVIKMQVTGLAWFTWTIAIRPLHNALLEDALDRAEIFIGKPMPQREWSHWVKFVRWIMRRGKKPGSGDTYRN
jgi:hypothetical protein